MPDNALYKKKTYNYHFYKEILHNHLTHTTAMDKKILIILIVQ